MSGGSTTALWQRPIASDMRIPRRTPEVSAPREQSKTADSPMSIRRVARSCRRWRSTSTAKRGIYTQAIGMGRPYAPHGRTYILFVKRDPSARPPPGGARLTSRPLCEKVLGRPTHGRAEHTLQGPTHRDAALHRSGDRRQAALAAARGVRAGALRKRLERPPDPGPHRVHRVDVPAADRPRARGVNAAARWPGGGAGRAGGGGG